jgi:dolichol-phosphate mannosyltransferase
VTQASVTEIDTTVVVMAFNEVATLPAVIEEIHSVLTRFDHPCEIVIVDDGSDDGTERVADELAADLPEVRVVHHAENAGLGGVYRTGFAEARGHYLTFFPADGQFPATIAAEFRNAIVEADLVLGYLPSRSGSPVGKLLSWIERLLYRMLLGPLPRFQGIMMLRTSLLRATPLVSTGRGWGVVMEFIIRVSRSPATVVSRPTTIRPRAAGQSKVNNTRTILANLRQLMDLRRALRSPTGPRPPQGSSSSPHA